MKEGSDGFVRADQIDLKSIDEQLERHLSKVLMKHKDEDDSASDNSRHSSSFASATKFKTTVAASSTFKTQRQDWEIDPSNLVIKTVIARGTFGTVHRGIYDGQDVAVKMLDWGEEGHRTDAEIAALRSAFTQEVAVWHKLQHPNVTKERDKRKAFKDVCNNFRSVMHYFFVERFLQPAEWFEKRLAYTRSVAASSMVGYIVGLGDRHAMNILIDQATAEVVHIDLGVAFEQGLMLKTPERVPFRLTRDVIDGMGVTGVEGVFRRCCEETLSVMRTNKEALLTIVEVFIHDPLYKWALSPLKALQRQKEMDDDLVTSLDEPQNDYQGNKDAARALLRVKQKLDGYEDGEMRSIHGQVQQLIQDAIDPERLCQMFPGWGAWL